METVLLGVPNVSEGRDETAVAAIAAAIEQAPAAERAVRLLDRHSDRDHDRSVFTFAGPPDAVVDALLRCARETLRRVDLGRPTGPAGQHPHVGALDVAPVVYLDGADRGAACAQALTVADRLGSELGLPVFLYGDLTAPRPGAPGRTRAQLRRGGLVELRRRMALPAEDPAALRPDFGPAEATLEHGATLVSARPPLVAFNLQLAAPATIQDARRIASAIREGGEQGLPGLRAIAVELAGGVAQVSMNVERPLELSLAEVVAAVARHARPASAELVGLAPAAAMQGFPTELPLPGFDPARQLIENAIGS